MLFVTTNFHNYYVNYLWQTTIPPQDRASVKKAEPICYLLGPISYSEYIYRHLGFSLVLTPLSLISPMQRPLSHSSEAPSLTPTRCPLSLSLSARWPVAAARARSSSSGADLTLPAPADPWWRGNPTPFSSGAVTRPPPPSAQPSPPLAPPPAQRTDLGGGIGAAN